MNRFDDRLKHDTLVSCVKPEEHDLDRVSQSSRIFHQHSKWTEVHKREYTRKHKYTNMYTHMIVYLSIIYVTEKGGGQVVVHSRVYVVSNDGPELSPLLPAAKDKLKSPPFVFYKAENSHSASPRSELGRDSFHVNFTNTH